jgi:hypothetical protein
MKSDRLGILLPIVLGMLITGLLAGEKFWETKAPENWSSEEMDILLHKSPWAGKAKVKFNSPSMWSRAGTPGNMGRNPLGLPEDKFKTPVLTVCWLSADPLAQVVRIRQKDIDSRITKETERYYVIGVFGFPPMMAAGGKDEGGFKQNLLRNTFLRRKNKAPILPVKVEESAAWGEGLTLLFYFPRNRAIQPQDKKVEFDSNAGFLSIRVEFLLEQMNYHGKRQL